MTQTYRVFSENEADLLIDWLARDSWPFHGEPRPTAEKVRSFLAEGHFTAPDVRTVWVVDGERRIGLLRIFDLDDETPLFDVRLRTMERGKGYGTAAVRWLTAHVFTEFAHVTRSEANTRSDNVAMQRVLRRCGYAKEAHRRRAWPAEGGSVGNRKFEPSGNG